MSGKDQLENSQQGSKGFEPVEFAERDTAFDLAAFECPRCAKTTSAQYYGPCEDCRRELRDRQRGEGGEVAAQAYEPKMNVTPNAVALKDD